MRLLSPFRRCARCHHMWEAHNLLDGPDGQITTGCGALILDKGASAAVGHSVFAGQCQCPVYVTPAPLHLVVLNKILGWLR